MTSIEKRVAYAVTLDKLGDCARRKGDYGDAKSSYDEALPIFRSAADRCDEYLRDLSLCLSKLGELHLAQNDVESAAPYIEEHYAIAKRMADSQPANGILQQDLAGALGRLQQLAMAMGDIKKALKYAESVVDILENLHHYSPENTSWLQDLAGAHYMIGYLHTVTSNRAEALREFGISCPIALDLERRGLLDAKGRGLIIGLASQYNELNEPEAASVPLSVALAFCKSPSNEENRDAFRRLEMLGLEIANKMLDIQKDSVVETLCDKLAASYAKGFGANDVNRLVYHNTHGIVLKRKGDLKNAELHYRKCYEESCRHFGNNHPGTLSTKRNLDWVIDAQKQG